MILSGPGRMAQVHMGNGKMGKVKLQSPGPHVMGPSPVQALQDDLQAAMEVQCLCLVGIHHVKPHHLHLQYALPSFSPPPPPKRDLDCAHSCTYLLAICSLTTPLPSPVSYKMLKKGSFKKGENGMDERSMQRSSSFQDDMLPRAPPASRRSTADSVGSADSVSVSTPSSSGTWGPGRRSADGYAGASAAAMRLSGSVKMSSPPSYCADKANAEEEDDGEPQRPAARGEAPQAAPVRSVAELRRSWGAQERDGDDGTGVGAGAEAGGDARPRRSSHGSATKQ